MNRNALSHHLSDETSRRLALGLIVRPYHRNRRRRGHYRANIAAVIAAGTVLAALVAAATLAKL